MMRAAFPFILLSGLLGCGKTPQPLYALNETSSEVVAVEPDRYDPNATGKIVGQVAWTGPVPDEASYRYPSLFAGEQGLHQPLRNPLIPRFGAQGGLGDVLIYLRGVDLRRAKPWDLPDAMVEIRNDRMSIVQGAAADSRFGFVRLGKEVEIVSHDNQLNLVRARESAFFTITLAKVHEPRRQRLSKSGRVELSSASMQYWMRSWLYVAEHPYFTRTDSLGDFELNDVPEGTYELVRAVPDWHVERAERDPELMAFARAWYRPTAEQVRRIEVKRGGITRIEFAVKNEDFAEKKSP